MQNGKQKIKEKPRGDYNVRKQSFPDYMVKFLLLQK